MTVLAWLTIALAGLAIGATSIGGVLVVPALAGWLHTPLPEAIAVSSFAFLVTGLMAVGLPSRATLIGPDSNAPLMVCALMGSTVGAALAGEVPGAWISAWIGCLALASGVQALYLWLRKQQPEGQRPAPRRAAAGVLGCVVGLGSALSGTGGPVMLLPLLLLMKQPLARAVICAQAIQVPIALSATAVHALNGRLDLLYGAAVALVLLSGALAGRALARRTSVQFLKGLTGLVLTATGIWILFF